MNENRHFSCKESVRWILTIYFLTIACGLPLVFTNGYYNITKNESFVLPHFNSDYAVADGVRLGFLQTMEAEFC